MKQTTILPLTAKLYRALFEISALRDEVRALEMAPDSESRYLVRLALLEAAAVRLADEYEQRDDVRSH